MNIVFKTISGALWFSLGAAALGGLLGLAGAKALESHNHHSTEPKGV